MEFQIKRQDKARKIALFLAWTVSLMGLFFVIAWNVQGGSYLSTVPIKGFVLSYYSAIAIFFSGLCFLNLIYLPKIRIFKIIALVTFVLSLARILEIITDQDFGFSNYLAHTLFSNIKNLPSVLIGGAVNTLLNAIVFLIWPLKNRTNIKSAFINVLLAMTILLSLEGVSIYLLPISPSDFVIKAPIHPVFAISQVFLALGLIAYNTYEDTKAKIYIIKWFSVFIGLGVLLFHFFLMTALLHQKRLSEEETLKDELFVVKNEIQMQLTSLGNSLHRFTNRLEVKKDLKVEVDDLDVMNYLNDTSYIHSIMIVDENFNIVKIASKNGVFDLQIVRDTLEKSLKTFPVKSHVQAFCFKSNQTALLASPAFWDQKFQGAVFFELNLHQFFNSLTSLSDNPGFITEIRVDDSLLYQSANDQSLNDVKASLDGEVSIYGMNFQIIIRSTSTLLVNKIIKALILLIATGGILGGFVTGFIIYLIQVLREKIQVTEKIKNQLAMSNEIMQVMNEADNIQIACDKILKIMHEHFNWQLFFYWQLNKKENTLELVHVTSIPEGSFAFFEKTIRELPKETMALYKEAFTTKEALFTADLTKSNSIISKAAIHDGIKGTFALPVFQKREVMGVFELFKKEVFDLEPELGWVDLMKIIGNQFTVFIERRESHLLDKELTALVSTTSDGIYKVDLDLNIRTWNLGAQVIYGYLPEEIIGQKVEMLYPKEHVFELKNIQESLLKFKTIEHFQTVRKTKNNQKIWVENSYAPIVNEKGKVCAYSVISRDITQQKAVSDALKLNEEKFRHFVESTQSWLWEVDLVGNFTFSNNASLELLGYSLDEIRNLNWKSLFLEKDKLEKDFIELRAKPNSWKKKLIQVLSKNGSVLWLESSVEEVRNQNLEPIGYRGVCRDVTKEVKIDISKNEFISMVSHELRTPLTSIIGAIGLMKVKKEMDVESIELLDLADRNADRLLKLINDILDIEKLSLGKILLNNKNYEFSNVIHEAINIARTQAEKENIQIKEEKIFNNIFIYVDQDRLVQVILNLLSNAIKFSPKNGFIVVSNERRDGFIRLNIKDFGPGIPYEIQGRLFEKFVQGQTGDTKVKGTGLGLNISKALIEQMGGSIGFTSQPTMGSTFFIDLPITKQGA